MVAEYQDTALLELSKAQDSDLKDSPGLVVPVDFDRRR